MGEQPEGTEASGLDRGGDEPRLDAPLEERREPLVDKGSASGLPRAGGTRATDFRPGKAELSHLDEGGEEAVGAGTGVAARDAGEQGAPRDLEEVPGAGSGDLTDEAGQWSAVGGEGMTDEGAAGGPLRDEPTGEESGQAP